MTLIETVSGVLSGMTRAITIFSLSVVVIGVAAATYAQDDAMKSVKGLPGVSIVIEGLPDRSQNPEVITKEIVQPDIEGKLRAAGIRVLTAAEALQQPSRPSLVVNVSSTHTPGDIYASIVLVSVRQRATLINGPAMVVTTWQDGGSGWATAADHAMRERELIARTVERFVNAWKIVNAPK